MKIQTYQNFRVLDVCVGNLTKEELSQIIIADWFEPQDKSFRNAIIIDGSLLSEEVFNLLSAPSDYGINPKTVIKIDDCLKRWNEKDGFYHA